MSSTVLFASEDKEISVRVPLGDGGAAITDGYARWTVVDRDGKHSITDFDGQPPYQQTIPVLFDGWKGSIKASSSVEGDIRLLERLAAIPAGGRQPRIIRITGNVRRPDLRWVIQGPIAWATGPGWDELITDPVSGERYRQAGTVTLLAYKADELLNGAGEPKDKQGRRLHTTRVRKGEKTLRDVAKRVYGTRNRARDLARLNDLPLSKHLKPNQLLLLPA
jgi:hypothetical protein